MAWLWGIGEHWDIGALEHERMWVLGGNGGIGRLGRRGTGALGHVGIERTCSSSSSCDGISSYASKRLVTFTSIAETKKISWLRLRSGLG